MNEIKLHVIAITKRKIPNYISLDDIVIEGDKITFIYTLPILDDPNKPIFPLRIEHDLISSIVNDDGIYDHIEIDPYDIYENVGIRVSGKSDILMRNGPVIRKLTYTKRERDYIF